jgi:hypothetical protein
MPGSTAPTGHPPSTLVAPARATGTRRTPARRSAADPLGHHQLVPLTASLGQLFHQLRLQQVHSARQAAIRSSITASEHKNERRKQTERRGPEPARTTLTDDLHQRHQPTTGTSTHEPCHTSTLSSGFRIVDLQ